MKLLKKTLIFLVLVSSVSYASWPQFSVLNPSQVQNLIDQKDCPAGYGKIALGTQVEIINKNIPNNQKWYWVYSGNTQCQKLPLSLQYLDLQPRYNVYSGQAMTTYYGNMAENLFSFTFTVPAGQCPDNSCPWDCGSFAGHNPPLIIGCAQDTKQTL